MGDRVMLDRLVFEPSTQANAAWPLSVSGRTKKKVVGGRHRGAENSTPCITWGPQPQWGGNPPPPVIRALLSVVRHSYY